MVTPSTALQAGFILASLMILTLSWFPALNLRFVSYGSRRTNEQPPSDQAVNASKHTSETTNQSFLSKALDLVSALQVPHDWFLHFYVASVLSSAFWLLQIFSGGSIIRLLCLHNDIQDPNLTMTFDQVMLTWTLMAIQGGRRLTESVRLLKPSTSKMWFVHWLLGLIFYVAIGVAVWIDGSSEILALDQPISSFRYSYPSIKTMVGVPLFIMASGIQHDCHAYLASLKKYTLPQHPMFNTFVCPHYAAEIMIYLSLSIVSAPLGLWLNRTVFAAFIFVTVNLSVTASDTKAWYAKKFGKDKVADRWTMLPGIW